MKSKLVTGAVLLILLLSLTVMLFLKGLELKNLATPIDSNGVNIHLFGLKLFEGVNQDELVSYANTFLVLCVATLTACLYPIWLIIQVVLAQFNSKSNDNMYTK